MATNNHNYNNARDFSRGMNQEQSPDWHLINDDDRREAAERLEALKQQTREQLGE